MERENAQTQLLVYFQFDYRVFKEVPLLFVTQKGRHCIREDDGIFSRSLGTAVLWIGDKEITKDND